jgi:hypothetical protein
MTHKTGIKGMPKTICEFNLGRKVAGILQHHCADTMTDSHQYAAMTIARQNSLKTTVKANF